MFNWKIYPFHLIKQIELDEENKKDELKKPTRLRSAM